MAVRAVAATSLTTSGSSNTINLPGSIAAGELLVAMFVSDGTGQTLSATGWNVLTTLNLTLDGQQVTWMWKAATGSEGSTFTLSIASSNGWPIVGCVGAWTGRDTTSPISASATTPNNTNTTWPTSLSMTGVTAAAGDDLLVIIGFDASAASSRYACVEAGGTFTERADSSIDWTYMAVYTKDGVSAGATGSTSLTVSRTTGTANVAYGGFTIALKAASGGAPADDALFFAAA